jgi:predicted Ser/Thr protein kinase
MGADVWRQAKGVLAEALMCPPGEREAWVAERCADPVLRREVQAYLHDYDEEFLETVLTVSDTFDHLTPSDEEPAPDIDPGVRVGRYVVLERLGAGGMGRVYLGDDTGLHRKVALKCLIASGSNDDLRAKILHEAQSAARINHPNIAVVHDVVEHEGRPFLVMEYVEGESLAAVLRRERPAVEQILSMGRQLASALTAAHGKGIIHRDLKPANIQVTPDGSVKILDFGVAQAMSVAANESGDHAPAASVPQGTSATLRSGRGLIVHPGTPAYMSPEQMFGKPIDQRSDIYSLGVVLYEMATGHRPYSTDNPLDVVLALSRSLLRPTGVETDVSPEVSDVIGKMLAVKVEDRYQSAAEVEAAIAALITPDRSAAAWERPGLASKLRTVVRVSAVALCVPAGLTALGFAQTEAFNLTLGRIAPFNVEPWTIWLETGSRSLVLPLLYMLGISFVVMAGRFLIRMLSLSSGIDHLLTTGLTRSRRLSSRLGLDNPVVLGQAVAAVGFVAMAFVVVAFFDVVNAGLGWINTFPTEQFLPLAPRNRSGWFGLEAYAFVLSVLTLFFGKSVLSIVRLRSRQAVRSGIAPLAVVVVMFVGTITLLELPYRIQWRNKFDRADIGGERCYVIGEHDDDWLVYCPDRPAPRNRVVKASDPQVRKPGVVESIFVPRETSR